MNFRQRLAARILGIPSSQLPGSEAAQLPNSQLAISPNLIRDDGWRSHGRRHDLDHADIQTQYDDALTAWRKNPMAWRIIQITTDYTVGEGIKISSPDAGMQRFIEKFWFHPENRIGPRLHRLF